MHDIKYNYIDILELKNYETENFARLRKNVLWITIG